MAANSVLRTARQILKFLADGHGFDRVMKNVRKINKKDKKDGEFGGYRIEVVSALPGKCTCEVNVDESHLNRGGAMHGGYTASLVDVISTVAIMTADKPPGVSVDLNVTFMKAARLGDTLVIDAECLKLGKTLAFAAVDIRNKSDGTLIAQGRQTKHIAT